VSSKWFRRSFVVFRVILGVVVFLLSASAVLRASSGHIVGALRSHLTILAVMEAVAALLFLIPKTAKVGGGILLVIFGVVLAIHGVRGQLALFVYAAGVVLVMVEGGSYRMG